MTPRKAPRAFAVVALALIILPGAAHAVAAGDGQAAATDATQLEPAPTPPFPAPPPLPAELTALDELVGPIALYPDPLLALLLPASTVPEDVSSAQAYLVQYGDMTQIDRQPWDPSVRG
ncbi:MAG TPA: DUF3300 domain-containing protein, partial [Opitutaceae bacterium]